MSKSDLRPIEHLRATMRLYPSTGRMVDEFRADKGKGLPDWPAWCFVPMAGWYALASQDNYTQLLHGQRLPLHLIPDVGKLAAIGSWRYSQGVYRLDADLQRALGETLIVGDIPCEVLYRLPEWCVYVETPGREWLGSPLYGYWCHLEYDINTHRSELRLLLDTETDLVALPIHIGPWTVTEAIDRMISESNRQVLANKIRINQPVTTDDIQIVAAAVNPLISLLLYLCSEAPDVDDEREPGVSPSRPKPTRTKRGWRLFPAEKPRIWTVGRHLGQQLRKTSAELTVETGRSVKPHLRKGHWHGYWLGPRKSERKFIYKWIMPMIVSGGE